MLELLAGERARNESDKAVQACNDYLRMGPGRTVAGLLRQYQKCPENSSPTRSLGTINKWSQRHNWPERAAAYDHQLEEAKNERRREVMESGLALDYERVRALTKLAAYLEEQIYETDARGRNTNVWLRDVKILGRGEDATVEEIERFNARLLEQYRGILDDLAQETGGRRQKPAGSADDPLHSVTMSVEEWRAERERRRRQALEAKGLLDPVTDGVGDDSA